MRQLKSVTLGAEEVRNVFLKDFTMISTQLEQDLSNIYQMKIALENINDDINSLIEEIHNDIEALQDILKLASDNDDIIKDYLNEVYSSSSELPKCINETYHYINDNVEELKSYLKILSDKNMTLRTIHSQLESKLEIFGIPKKEEKEV